jgi:ATP-dependent Clp protease ATP-binding subunit ClpA
MDVYRLSRAAQRVIEAAAKKALAAGHDRLASVHAVQALLESGGAAAAALAGRGVSPDRLDPEADKVYDGPRGGRARDLDRSGAEWRDLMGLARDEAENAGSHEIEPAHLFLAATADDDWTASRALRALGVDVEAARAEVERLARGEAAGDL